MKTKTNHNWIHLAFLTCACSALAACNSIVENAEHSHHSPLQKTLTAKQAKLHTLQAYPTPHDACFLLQPNQTIEHLFLENSIIIGCPNNEPGAISDRLVNGAYIVEKINHWTLLRLTLTPPTATDKNLVEIRKHMSDATLIARDDFHGTQIEYHDDYGSVWLVYPGNKSVLQGEWKVVKINNDIQIETVKITV